MEILSAVIVGVLFGCGTYLMLKRTLLRIIIGLALYSHAANILLMESGLHQGIDPIIGDGISKMNYVDPIPQALILTAIVIGFACTAFILVLAYKIFQNLQTDDLDELRGEKG
ncbi:Na(+)/H(+) antiporter subunit C [candidate division KSB1 bacterium]|nr:Na(+)/H(+) antiporter subunit C [candidate division KSB1 bacterium]